MANHAVNGRQRQDHLREEKGNRVAVQVADEPSVPRMRFKPPEECHQLVLLHVMRDVGADDEIRLNIHVEDVPDAVVNVNIFRRRLPRGG